MPIFPAIGAGLAALGGGSAAVGATLAATAVGGVASVIGSNNAANAARDAGQLQYQASQDAIAANNATAAQLRADNEPFRQYGLSAASALAGGLGLATSGYNGGPGAPGMMTGGYSTGAQTAPAGDGVDWNAYLQQNPDALANFQDINSQGRTDALATDPIAFAKFHYQADGARRELPKLAAAAPAENPTTPGTAPGYTDPTAPGGYTMPERPMTAPLDVSAGAFQASPGYQFSLDQGNKALDSIASTAGGRFSGQRLKAAGRFNVGMADQEFSDWRNYTTGQFNNDRAFTEQAYLNDRSNLNSRYDTRNSTLLSMAGFGTGATAANSQAAQNTTQANNSALMTGAQAQGGAAVGAANAWNQGLNNIMTTGSYLAGRYAGGGASDAWSKPQIQLPSYMQPNPMTGMTGRY